MPWGILTSYIGSAFWLLLALLLVLPLMSVLFFIPPSSALEIIFPMHLLMGRGQPLTYVAGQNAMLLSAPVHETGTVGAVCNTASQLGSAMGLAIVTAIINAVSAANIYTADPPPGITPQHMLS
ncbi:hypothetical protein NQZ79_g1742 [Umbelopsis isabellina]|nr:hypothetical protein NQZ79_g1742 [Umbelopsis isabellina]